MKPISEEGERERERERDMCAYMKCIHRAKHVSGIVPGVFIYIYIRIYTDAKR